MSPRRHTTTLALRLLLVALAVGLVIPAGAAAAVRAVSIEDPLDNQPSEFDPHYRTDVQRVTVTDDEASGKLTVSFRFYEPEPDATLTGYVALSRCDHELDSPYLNFTMYQSDTNDWDTGGNVNLTGYSDSLSFEPTRSADGRTLTGTVTHPALAGQDFRCVTNGWGHGADSSDRDYLPTMYFPGFEPPPPPPEPAEPAEPAAAPEPPEPEPVELTAATAAAHARAYLTRRFGKTFTASRRRWLKCPSGQILDDGDDWPSALCMFEFKTPHRYRGGSFAVVAEDDHFKTRYYYDSSYTKRMRTCRSLPRVHSGYVNGVRLNRRKLQATGFLSCLGLPAGNGMVGDIDAIIAHDYPRKLRKGFTVGLHGTNTAGFSRRVRFPCSVRSHARAGGVRAYQLSCANQLGDRFRYRVTVSRHATAASRPSRG